MFDILFINYFMMLVSLLVICWELYENVGFLGVVLDWFYSNFRFFDVINYSINMEGKIFYNKLKDKEVRGDF